MHGDQEESLVQQLSNNTLKTGVATFILHVVAVDASEADALASWNLIYVEKTPTGDAA